MQVPRSIGKIHLWFDTENLLTAGIRGKNMTLEDCKQESNGTLCEWGHVD